MDDASSVNSLDSEDPLSAATPVFGASTTTAPTATKFGKVARPIAGRPSREHRIAVILKSPSAQTRNSVQFVPEQEDEEDENEEEGEDVSEDDAAGAIISDLLLPRRHILKNTSNIALAASSTPGDSPSSSSATTPADQAALIHRGRPRGWKRGMSYAKMRGSDDRKHSLKATSSDTAQARAVRQIKAPKPPSSSLAKRRGRPPKSSSPPCLIYHTLDTPFVAFLCEWAGCKAELHNLETLRRHVYIVHMRDDNDLGTAMACRWGKCESVKSPSSYSSSSTAVDMASPSVTFPDAWAFRAHVEEVHLVPFSWHVGDGPQNTGIHSGAGGDGDEMVIADYLMDESGQQVTPSIQDQELEDIVTWKNNRRKLKELLIRRNENLPDDDSDTPIYDD